MHRRLLWHISVTIIRRPNQKAETVQYKVLAASQEKAISEAQRFAKLTYVGATAVYAAPLDGMTKAEVVFEVE